jgi:glycosyltransferase involved in cell wall biosynthesis
MECGHVKILMSIGDEMDRNSGGPGATYELAQALQRQGHQVDIISFSNLRGPRKVKRHIYPFYVAWYARGHREYDLLDFSEGDGWVLSEYWRMTSPRNRPTLITRSHSLIHLLHDQLMMEAALNRHKFSWMYPLYNGGWRLREVAISIRNADSALVLNNAQWHCVVDRIGIEAARAFVVRNGIAPAFIEHAQHLMATPAPSTPVSKIAFIGSFLPTKGILYLNEALRRVFTERPQTTITYFGVKELADLVVPSFPDGLRDRISVVPYYSNGDLPRLLEDFHIIAFPSLHEAFPLAPLEAMGCGLVPVASNVPGPKSYIEHERNGLLVPSRDSTALANAIIRLVDQPDLWAELRAGGLKTAALHSWDEVARQTLKLYLRASLTRDRRCRRGRRLKDYGQPEAPGVEDKSEVSG